MVSLSNVQSRIYNKVFLGIGSSAVVSSVLSSSTTKWGDTTTIYATGVTEKVVPYSMIADRIYEPFGELKFNELDMVFSHLSSVTINSSIVYANKNYIITQLEQFPLLDGMLAYICRLSESV